MGLAEALWRAGRCPMTALYWIGLVITVVLLAYLIAALLLPEKFS